MVLFFFILANRAQSRVVILLMWNEIQVENEYDEIKRERVGFMKEDPWWIWTNESIHEASGQHLV